MAKQVSPLGASSAEARARRQANPEYQAAAEKVRQSAAIAELVILHRTRRKLTQAQLAEVMQTSVAAISRLESGRHLPSTDTLNKFARAVKGRLTISIEPQRAPERKEAAPKRKRTESSTDPIRKTKHRQLVMV